MSDWAQAFGGTAALLLLVGLATGGVAAAMDRQPFMRRVAVWVTVALALIVILCGIASIWLAAFAHEGS